MAGVTHGHPAGTQGHRFTMADLAALGAAPRREPGPERPSAFTAIKRRKLVIPPEAVIEQIAHLNEENRANLHALDAILAQVKDLQRAISGGQERPKRPVTAPLPAFCDASPQPRAASCAGGMTRCAGAHRCAGGDLVQGGEGSAEAGTGDNSPPGASRESAFQWQDRILGPMPGKKTPADVRRISNHARPCARKGAAAGPAAAASSPSSASDGQAGICAGPAPRGCDEARQIREAAQVACGKDHGPSAPIHLS